MPAILEEFRLRGMECLRRFVHVKQQHPFLVITV